MSKREKVLILPKEEYCPYDEKLVQCRFLRAISIGIRNNNIVMIFATGSKNVNISDEHLLQLVSEAVVNKSENNEKLRQHRKDLKVNKTETDENHKNPLLTELRKIRFEYSNQLAAFCSEILEIKQTVSHGYASAELFKDTRTAQ